jgi:hypothetical protein
VPLKPRVGAQPPAGASERFEVAVVLDEAWRSTRQHFWRWLLLLVIAAAIPFALFGIALLMFSSVADAFAFAAYGDEFGPSAVDKFIALLAFAVGIIGVVSIPYVWLGLIRNAYSVTLGGRPDPATLLRYDRFGWFLACWLIYTGVVAALSFPIPLVGLVVGAVLGLFGFALVAQPSITGFAALGSSWDRVTRHFWGFIGLRIVLLGVPVAILVLGIIAVQLGVASVLSGQDALMLLVALVVLAGMALAMAFAVAFAVTGDGIAYRRLYGEETAASPVRKG